MVIKDVHDTILFILNKEQNAYLSHEEIDIILDRAQLALFNQYHTNPKLPANVQLSVYGESQRIDDAISAFKQKLEFTGGSSPSVTSGQAGASITSGGVLTMPTDYMHLISLYTTVYSNTLSRSVYSSVQVLNEEELIERLESQVIPVSNDNPIAIMNSQNRIQLYPPSTTVFSGGGAYYFRRPNTPRFGYTPSGRTIVHDPTAYNSVSNTDGSVNLEWRDYDIMNIISIALSYYGISMSSNDIVQFGEIKNQQGQ